MAIEQIESDDTFERFEGYYLRRTDIQSRALAILEPGTFPRAIARLDEYHFQIFYKKAFGESEFHSSYDTLGEATESLKALNSEDQLSSD